MGKTIVNNNIKLKSGGGLLNDATDGLSVDTAYISNNSGNIAILAGENIDGATLPVPVFIPSTSQAEALLLTQGAAESQKNMNAAKWYANFFTLGLSDKLTKVTLRMQRYGSAAGNVNLAVYAVDGSNKPTGSALYTVSLDSASIGTSGEADYDFIFTSANLTQSATYALVVSYPGGSDSPGGYPNYIGLKANQTTRVNGWISTDSGSTWANSPDAYFKIYGYQTGIVAGSVSKSEGDDPLRARFNGFATSLATAGNSINVKLYGVVTGFTGLTPGAKYYVQDTRGTIGTSAGSTSIIVGVAINSTSLYILQDFSKS